MKVYINDCLECTSFEKNSELLSEKCISVYVPRFSEFAVLKLNDLNELEQYFHKKVEVGRKLQLCEKIIVHGLTDGLKPEYHIFYLDSIKYN